MSKDRKRIFHLASWLLQYPDGELVGQSARLRQEVSKLTNPAGRQVFTALLDLLESVPLLELQANYTRTFDFNPANSLDLTYHCWGDARERGLALIELNEIYRRGGYAVCGDELPDHLPLVLEFIAVASSDSGARVAALCRAPLAELAGRLHESGSPYAKLLAFLLQELPREGD